MKTPSTETVPAVAHRSIPWTTAYLAADAILFISGLWFCARTAYMRIDGVAGIQAPLAAFTVFSIFLFVSRNISLRISGGRMSAGLALEFAVLLAAVAAPPLIIRTSVLPARIYDAVYWLTIPQGAACSIIEHAPAASAVAAVFVIAAARLGRRLPFPRLAARTATAVAIATLVAYQHYAAPRIVLSGDDFSSLPGVKTVCPEAGRLGTVRDIAVSDEGTVWIASGRAGLFKVENGCASLQRATAASAHESFDKALIHPETGVVYALDSRAALVYEVEPEKARIIRTFSVATDWSRAPTEIGLHGNLLRAIYSGLPGLAEFEIDTGEQAGGLRFTREPGVGFRAGGWDMLTLSGGEVVALAGPAKKGGGSWVVRIDPYSFRVEASAVSLGTGGALALNDKTAFVTSVFEPVAREIDIERLRARRELPAASGARVAAVSIPNQVLFTTGSRDGKLVSTDIGSVTVLRENRVGGKVFALRTDPKGKELYIAASNGVFVVDIDQYLKSGDTAVEK
ncbi:MAG TPA: hypothetical protein PK745_06675 [bacterium]|nr:hypothetical protein [bacterium]